MKLRSTSSDRTKFFTESVIREMTRLASQHGAVNLAQGFPDFSAPAAVKAAACEAINADINQYAITWGSESLRRAIADKYQRTYDLKVDPETQLCVTCGSTEAMMAAILGLVNPGDEIIVFEPYYENYGPDALIAGASLRCVPLHYPDWTFDEGELSAAFNDHTQGIILNSPNNPTGKVFSREELEVISRLCNLHGAVAYSDEIYEHIVYDDHRHGGPHGHHQLTFQDLLGDWLASGLGDRPTRADPTHPQGPRLPHSRRRGAATGGGRGGP